MAVFQGWLVWIRTDTKNCVLKLAKASWFYFGKIATRQYWQCKHAANNTECEKIKGKSCSIF